MADKILQPALIIGLGGSGTEVVRRFKRRFASTYSDTPYIQLLGIDTAPQETETQERILLDEDEFIHAANFNSEYYVGDSFIDQWPEIRDWWSGYKLSTKQIIAGAGMRRPFGRLAMFVHHEAIVKRIRSHLHRIFNNDVFSSLPEHYKGALNVYIVASTCGGTGTGMFLDLAYLTQALVPQAMPQASVWVRGVLLLPSVFLDTGQVMGEDSSALQANAWGALTELDACMFRRAELPPMRHPRNWDVPRRTSPYHSCFFLGSQTAEGAVITDFGTLLERAAVHIQIELASPIMETGKARLDNPLEAIAAKPDSQGKPRLYSSFSNEWLELPSHRVISRWTRQLACQTLERLAASGSGSIPDSVLDEKDSYGRLRTLSHGRGLNKYLPRVEPYVDSFMDLGDEGRPANTLIEKARTLQSEADRQIESTALKELVADNARRLPEEIREVVRDSVSSQSLSAVHALLDSVLDELNRWISNARNDIGATRSDPWLLKFQDDIQLVKKGVLGKQEKFVSGQRQLVIDAVERARADWGRSLRAAVASELEAVLPTVVTDMKLLRELVEQLQASIDSAIAIVKGIPDPVVPAGSGAGAVSDSEIDGQFSQADRQELLLIAVEKRLRGLVDRQFETSEALAKYAMHASHEAVLKVSPAYLATLDIPASEIANRLAGLSPLAVFRPDWSAHPDAKEVHRLWLVGLPESSREKQQRVTEALPPKIREISQFVLHGDEGRVVMTVQHHGFPLYSLAEMEACRTAYEQSDTVRRRLCKVFPDEELREWQLFPATGSESRQNFGVGLALSLVRRVGENYTCTVAGTDYDLGGHADPSEARRRARDEFLRSGLAGDVEALVNRRLKEQGNELLFEELNAWVGAQKQRIDSVPEYPKEFKGDVETVEAYLERIRPY